MAILRFGAGFDYQDVSIGQNGNLGVSCGGDGHRALVREVQPSELSEEFTGRGVVSAGSLLRSGVEAEV
jgi:hypothetical protein